MLVPPYIVYRLSDAYTVYIYKGSFGVEVLCQDFWGDWVPIWEHQVIQRGEKLPGTAWKIHDKKTWAPLQMFS